MTLRILVIKIKQKFTLTSLNISEIESPIVSSTRIRFDESSKFNKELEYFCALRKLNDAISLDEKVR